MRYRILLRISLLAFALITLSASLGMPPVGASGTESGIVRLTIGAPRTLQPSQLSLIGDVATQSNTMGQCSAPWLARMPAGSIILGVNPQSCRPSDWQGGSATAQLQLPDRFSPTVLAIKLSWPDRDGKGLHSPEPNRSGRITLDGQPLWEKRGTVKSTFDDYYTAQHYPILTTIVLTQTAVHTLRISVDAHTAWDIAAIELYAYPMPSNIRGIGYSPYRDCQTPTSTLQPSAGDVQADLFRLFHTANAIRTYAATGINQQIPALANQIGLPVFAGAWLDATNADEAETRGLIALANTTRLAGAIVGNEYYLRHRTRADIGYLVQRIQQVRAGLHDRSLPLMSAEIDGVIFDWESNSSSKIIRINPIYQPVIEQVDIVLVHIYPFWNGLPIDGAAAFAIARYNAIRNLMAQQYPGKRVVIGETGWPSGGDPLGRAVPSLENQRRYMLEFLVGAERDNVDFMYFDTFDELWKIQEPGHVGQNWGYTFSNQSVKHDFNSLLLPTSLLLSHHIALPIVAGKSASPGLASAAMRVTSRHPAQLEAATPAGVFPIYSDWLADPGRFVPSGWIGDTANISLFECDRSDPHGGEMSIRATFSPDGPRGWGGVSWQDPNSNWGKQAGGYDMRGARRLSFWARGAQGGEVVEFQLGGIGQPGDPYRDSIQPARSSQPIVLTPQWQHIVIDLSGLDLSRVVGGFSWVASRCLDSRPITFYLDDISIDYTDAPDPAPPQRLFYVYGDHNAGCTHFAPSGFMGDIEDITIDPSWSAAPYRGTTAMRMDYSAQASRGKGWGGVYWQEPENNWGTLPGGFDLSWANKLTFHARGAHGGEHIQFFVGGIGTASDAYPDSLRPALSTDLLNLSTTWQTYTIDLRGHNLAHVIGGFGWVASRSANPGGATFYLDDIVFAYDPAMPPPQPRTIFPIYTDIAAPDNHYTPSLWMGDAANPGAVTLDDSWTDQPYSGQTAIKIAYTAQSVGWAGMDWVHPADNIGDRPGGFDLRGATQLTFWARSDTPNAEVTFLAGGVGYNVDYQGNALCSRPSQPYPDSLCPASKLTLRLTASWTKYTIDLRNLAPAQLQSVVGGFGWAAKAPVVFYLDDIVIEFQ